MRLFAIIVMALGSFADPFVAPLLDEGERDGRRGNVLYGDEAFEDAAEAYASGLAALSENAAVRLRYGLSNNLGAALLKSGDPAAAGQAFGRALASAGTDADFARTTYNAGNAAHAADDLQTAVDFYRQSLLRDPDNEDAKFNYEFARRKLEQQQEQQQQQGGSQDEDPQEQQDQGQQQQEGDERQPQNGENPEPRQEGDPQEQNQASPQPTSPSEQISDAQAERILEALQNDEEQLLRQVQRPSGRPRRVEKDW